MRSTFYILILCLVPAAFAQNTQPTAADVRSAYDALRFDQVMTLGGQLLLRDETSGADRVAAHRLMALVSFSRQQPTTASKHLNEALAIDPDLSFDTSEASPSFINFFAAVKQEFEATRPNETPEEGALPEIAAVVYVTDGRAPAALRSMILPGWGQFHKGERTKALVVAATWVGVSAATIGASIERSRARLRYEEERDVQNIEGRFDDYSSWQRRRNFALGAAGAVWLYSFVDALLSGASGPTSSTSNALAVSPAMFGSRPGASLSLRF